MVIPTTGLVFLFGSFIYFYLSRRFLVLYKKENNGTAKFFGYGFLFLGLNYLVAGVPALFLIESPAIWRLLTPLYSFFMALGWGTILYSVVSQQFKKYSKIYLFLYGIYVFLYASRLVSSPPNYYYVDGVLSWDISMSVLFPMIFLLPFIFVVLITFFFNKARKTNDPKTRIRSFGLALAASLFLLNCFIDFILLSFLKLHPVFSDLNYLITFSTLALTLIFTWFYPPRKYVAKVE